MRRNFLVLIGTIIVLVGMAFATGPAISAIAVASVTANSATITWTTSPAATSQIFYGLNGNTNLSTNLDHSLVTSHSITLQNLAQQMVYTYEVQSTDSGGSTTSATNTFGLCNPGSPNTGLTNVTAQVNAGYATGTLTALWVNDSGVSTSTPTSCGATFPTTQTTTVGLPGNINFQLPDNNYMVPSPGHWHFTLSNAAGLSADQIVTGQSIDLTTLFGLQAAPAGGASPVTSVFSRIGAVTAQSGDYTCAQVTNCATNVATVTLNSSQLNNLFTTPVGFGPTPPSGSYILPVTLVMEYQAGSTPFSVSGVTLELGLTTFLTDGGQAWQSLSAPGFLDQTVNNVAGQAGASGVPLLSSALNGAQLAVACSGGAISAGDGSLKVTVYYVVLTL